MIHQKAISVTSCTHYFFLLNMVVSNGSAFCEFFCHKLSTFDIVYIIIIVYRQNKKQKLKLFGGDKGRHFFSNVTVHLFIEHTRKDICSFLLKCYWQHE